MFDNFNSHLSNWSFSESSSLLGFFGSALNCIPPEILLVVFLATVIFICCKIYRLIVMF